MIELLNKRHNRLGFDCGNEVLNNYLKHRASQDVKRKLAACFVLSEKASPEIMGFYTLSNNSIPLLSFPESLQIKLPKSYKSIPTTLIGRLAISKKFQGQGIGKILLIDALKRSYLASTAMGSFAVVVDPIDEPAKNFYAKYDFIQLPDSGKMLMSMKTLNELFG